MGRKLMTTLLVIALLLSANIPPASPAKTEARYLISIPSNLQNWAQVKTKVQKATGYKFYLNPLTGSLRATGTQSSLQKKIRHLYSRVSSTCLRDSRISSAASSRSVISSPMLAVPVMLPWLSRKKTLLNDRVRIIPSRVTTSFS